jgi:hypothetical protein
MSKLSVPLCLVAAVIAIAPLACADEFTDPAFFGDGASCTGIPWCNSIQPAFQEGIDPLSGDEAIVYYLSPTYFPANASNEFVSGDVQFVTVSTNADVDLLRFETLNIGTVSIPDYVAAVFLFNGSDEPASLQSANVTQTIADGVYSPNCFGQSPTCSVGGVFKSESAAVTSKQTAPGADSGQPVGSYNPPQYDIIDGPVSVVPEPGSWLLMGTMLGLVGLLIRKGVRTS